jgi:CheY-like chemotaxis protein
MPGHQPYIVLIDDDEDDLEILSSSLKLLGINVKSFESGETAFHFLHSIGNAEFPSLIILDYNMQKINGEEVLFLLKNHLSLKQIPVVMYSTHMTAILQKALIALGAQACFIKPNSYLDIISQVESFKNLLNSSSSNQTVNIF